MKLLALLVAGVGSVAALVRSVVPSCPCEVAVAQPVSAEYVEARDCTVFGGACHVNGEAETQGRSGLAAWHFEGGGRLVAALEGEGNLGRPGARRAVLYVDGATRDEVALAVAAAGVEVVAEHAAEVTWRRDGDSFHVAVPGVLELSGVALADRRCCSMPSSVWYRPLATEADGRIAGAVVGKPSRCRFAGSDGLAPWTYEDANTAFVGTFHGSPALP